MKNLLFALVVCFSSLYSVYGNASIKLCFNLETNFLDNGVDHDPTCANGCEDFIDENGFWDAPGLRTYIYRDSTQIWAGYLDNDGCTPVISVSGTGGNYSAVFYSYGKFGTDNYIYSRKLDNSLVSFAWGYEYLAHNISYLIYPYTRDVSLVGTDVEAGFSVYMAAAWAWKRQIGNISNSTITIIRGDTPPTGISCSSSCFDSPTDRIWIDTSDDDNRYKFIVAHELGHYMLKALRPSKSYVTTLCSGFREPNGDACSHVGTINWTRNGKEFQRCALNEGFADFYSAAAFNDDSNAADCVLNYPTLSPGWAADCEFDATYSNAIMDSICDNNPFAGYGVPFDWARTYWDVLTADNSINMSTFGNWLDTATNWNNTDGYSRLDTSANTIGGALNTHWDYLSPYNGVDQ